MAVPSLTVLHRFAAMRAAGILVLVALALSACSVSGQHEAAATRSPAETADADRPNATSPDPANESTGNEAPPTEQENGEASSPPADETNREPQPYIPAGRPGNMQDYVEMIDRLQAAVPAALQADVPWPDLRSPNPIDAQISIFELWIWMAANHPEPKLVEAMAAPGSPSREDISGTFGLLDAQNLLETRTGQGYRAFDHVVVTFESAGLPLWLARDVPANAVVIYYSDNSGPVEVTDRDTGEFVERRPAIPTRTWLSIMVPSDVGWQLWRDQLIEPNDSELEVPDVPPLPGADEDRRDPGV